VLSLRHIWPIGLSTAQYRSWRDLARAILPSPVEVEHGDERKKVETSNAFSNGIDYEDQIAPAISSTNCRVKAPSSCMVVYVVSSGWLLSAGA